MKDNKDEIILWNGLRSGNERDLHSLYVLYYHHLLRYGLSLSGDNALSKEYINQLFFSLWTNRQKLPEVNSPKAYIITSYKNKIIFRKRDSWNLKIVLPDNPEVYSENQAETSSEDTLIELQEYESLKLKIKSILGQLSERQRELIIARFIDELSYEEIASRLNISVRTVYNSIHESLKILRSQLNEKDFF